VNILRITQICRFLLLYLSCLLLTTAAAHGKSFETGTTTYGVEGFGERILYISENGVRINFPVAGLNIICKKPKYEVVWFNPKNKTIKHETIAALRARSNMTPKEISLPRLQRTPITFGGVSASKITVRSSPGTEEWLLPSYTNKTKRPQKLHTHYIVSTDIAVTPPLLLFLNTYYGVPNFGGVLLGCSHTDTAGGTATQYSTSRVEKGKFPSDLLDVPSGYKECRTQMEVATGPGYRDQFDDLARDMGIGEKFGK